MKSTEDFFESRGFDKAVKDLGALKVKAKQLTLDFMLLSHGLGERLNDPKTEKRIDKLKEQLMLAHKELADLHREASKR